MSRRGWAVVAHVVAWSLLIGGVTFFVLRWVQRDDAEPAAAASGPHYASMAFPATLSLAGPDRGRIGSEFRFSVESFSDAGARSVTLYDGTRPIDTVEPSSSGRPSSLALPGLSVGRHTVHAAVTDADGEVASTAPVSILVGEAPGADPVPVEVPVEDGERLPQVAERLGLPRRDLVKVGGGRVVALIEPDAGAAQLSGDRLVITPGLDLGTFALSATPRGCGVALEATGASDPVNFYRGGGEANGWVQVGRPQSDGATDVADLTPGTHVFFARAGKVDSAQVAVTVPDRCARSYGWTGDASIVDGELILAQPAANVFLHLSVDGRPWIRVPASQDEAIIASTRTSIAHLLPALNGSRLQLEVWKFQGDIPLRIAAGELKVPSDAAISTVVGEPSAVSLTVDTPDGARTGIQLDSQDEELAFTWTAASPAVSRVRWQVLTTDRSTSDLSLSPPGLLATGVVEGDGSGTFTIDTADIPRADRPQPAQPTSGKGTTALALQPPLPTGSLSGQTAFGSIVSVDQLTQLAEPVELPVAGSTVFVRVVTENGPSAASPDVVVHLPTPQSADTGVDFEVTQLTTDAGRAPNPKAVGCLIVDVPWSPTGDEPGYNAQADPWALTRSVARQFYPQDSTVCPGAFPPPKGCDAWYCEVVEFVVDAAGAIVSVVVQLYELVAYAYNGAIDAVVDVVSKLNPLCLALGAADGGAGKSCASVTGFATKAAITAVLASVGLPPSLPTAGQLEAIAAGELDQLAVELMKQLGVPCDTVKAPAGFDDALAVAGDQLDAPVLAAAADPCLAIAHLLIGEVRAAATANGQRALAEASGLPAFPEVKGFSMVADPRGQAAPLQVDVTARVAEANADPSGIFCQVVFYDPHRSGLRGVGPFLPLTIRLEPTSPDGRTWSGSGVRTPREGPTLVNDLQGGSWDLALRSYHPATCRIEEQITRVDVGPPLP